MAIIKHQGLLDMHVHLREPGQTHKEDIEHGALAACNGGFCAVACMPNTVPPADKPEIIRFILEKAARQDAVRVYPIAAITVGQKGRELTDFKALKEAGAIALSDDGYPVTDDAVMEAALIAAREAGLPVIAHCEPETVTLARDIALCEKLGTSVHFAHISLAESVELIRRAKARGIKVTCETAPHYLTTRAVGKMNPPLATERDVEAIRDGLADGTIDVIATDHAPHTSGEKAVAYERQPNGVTGLETAVGVCFSELVHTGLLTADALLRKMSQAPAAILGIDLSGTFVEIDSDAVWRVDSSQFRSKARNTPFEGLELRGKVIRCGYNNA